MKFSIVTPVFNGMSYISQCIGSVRGQLAPYGAESVGLCRLMVDKGSLVTQQPNNLKAEHATSVCHYIQDGRSTDGTVEFLNEQVARQSTAYPAKAPYGDRYQLSYVSEADKGMYDAINKAWAKSEGDILSWLNSDEQYLPGTLKKIARYFDENPGIDAVFGNMIVITPGGDPLCARREIPLRRFYVANGSLYAASCATFYRRKLWDECLIRLDESYRYASDMDMVLRALERNVRYGFINDYLSLFTFNKGQNLSCSPKMIKETKRIQTQHGAFHHSLLRKTVCAMRWGEKCLSGCYVPSRVRYDFATDETPHYRHFEGRVGYKLSFD
jgi:glycosyltransferase involved in cell wall biosynthesis